MADGTPLEEAAALRLVTAAATAAGVCPPDPAGTQAWQGRVRDLAVSLFRMVPDVAERCGRLADVFPLPGVILDVREMSGRGVIVVRPEIGKLGKDENLRTPFLNLPEGRAMFDLAKALVGQRCRFGKRTETFLDENNAPGKMSLCEWIEPLEAAVAPPGAQASPSAPSPAPSTVTAPAQATPATGPLDAHALGELRTRRPASFQSVVDGAAAHLGLDPDEVDREATAMFGPEGPRSTNQLFRLWNHLITAATSAAA